MGVFIRKLTGWTIAEVASWENLQRASRRAARGKRRRPDVEAWLLREESELLALRAALLDGAYAPGPYRFFEIREPKRRTIAAAPFRDRVVHHALCQFMAPVLERRFIARSFSCRLGKGTTAARECCRQLTNRFRYVLKCDVSKFFPNIDHAILLAKLDGVSRCSGVAQLIRLILGSYRAAGPVSERGRPRPLATPDRAGADNRDHGPTPSLPVSGQDVRAPGTPLTLFAGDDWLEAAARPRGLPIGNLTSQLWGNFYLDALDHWITESETHGAYLRYTDDFLLFGDDKARLWELRAGITEQLAAVRFPQLFEADQQMVGDWAFQARSESIFLIDRYTPTLIVFAQRRTAAVRTA